MPQSDEAFDLAKAYFIERDTEEIMVPVENEPKVVKDQKKTVKK
jgi:hypothetical protein